MNVKCGLLLALILLLLAGCAPEPASVNVAPEATPEATSTSAPEPAVERTGLTILADGVVQPAQPALPLAFETGGKLLAVAVRPGDWVQVGDVVATLDDTQARDQVARAGSSLELAELALDVLSGDPDPAALASARAGLASAQAGLASARSSLAAVTAPPGEAQVLAARQNLQAAQQALQNLLDLPDPDAVQIARSNLTAAEMQVQAAQAAYDQVAPLAYASLTGEAMSLWQATTNYEHALAEYNEALEGATADQLTAARARVTLAQADLDALQQEPDAATVAAAEAQVAAAEAQVAQARAALDALLAGASAADVARAEIEVDQARLALAIAERGLAAVELGAPISGVVLAVHAAPGTLVGGGSPVVTLLDVTQLQLHTTNLSERDLAHIVVGRPALVTLKAYPDHPIEASVFGIGMQAGETVGDAATFPVTLVLSATGLDLRPGMTGRVEIDSGP